MGRLHPEKAQDVMVRAFAAPAPEHAIRRLQPGRGGSRPALRDPSTRPGVAGRIDRTGRVHAPDPRCGTAADVFALPSVQPGTPKVLLEAMSWDLPVVVSDASPGPLPGGAVADSAA